MLLGMEILVLKQEFAKEDIKLEYHDSAKFEEWLIADQDDLDKRLNSENVKSLIDFKGRSLASFKLLTARDRYRLGAEKVAQQGFFFSFFEKEKEKESSSV